MVYQLVDEFKQAYKNNKQFKKKCFAGPIDSNFDSNFRIDLVP